MNLLDRIDAVPSRVRGRSYWQVRYRDGTTRHELQCEWTDLPRKGLVAARLICPNGQIAEVGNDSGGDISDRLFQFKNASADIVMSVGGGAMGGSRRTESQILGLVQDPSGKCYCVAWNYRRQQLEQFVDNLFFFQYGNPGPLSFEVLGVKL